MDVNFDGIKVMIIDDSKTIRRTAETLLEKAGCEVVTAVDGFDALAKIADSNPDVIFVDIMMPRLDGYQTCALIKNNPEYANTPVIMLSSKDGLFDKARGRIVGSDEYLTKPFSKEVILFCHDLSFGDGWVRPRLAVHYAPVCSPMADGFCAFYLSPPRIKMFS